MKLFLPDNIFAAAFARSLPAALNPDVRFLPSSLITKELLKEGSGCALIPAADILNNKELFVSKDLGISFEGSLCNTYIYFLKDQDTVENISLAGDISSTEVVLTKILFKEIYNIDVSISLEPDINSLSGKNILMSGTPNFDNGRYAQGLSFSEEIIETLSFPFVNYVLASADGSAVAQINKYADEINGRVYDELEKTPGLDPETAAYIKQNASSLIVRFEQQDVEGIQQLLRLPYFHGMIDSIIEINLI